MGDGTDTSRPGLLRRTWRRMTGRPADESHPSSDPTDGFEERAGELDASSDGPSRGATAGHGFGSARAYVDHAEHLADELRLLDLWIRHRIGAARRHHSDNPLDQLRGLVLSDDEVDGLLRAAPQPPSGSQPSQGGRDAAEARAADPSVDAQDLAELEESIARRRAASAREGVFLALPHLATLFRLDRAEERILVACLAPEVDRKYDKLYAYLQDDVTRKRPSVDLMLRLLGLSWRQRLRARRLFDPDAPLVEYRLVRIVEPAADGPLPLLGRALKLDDRIADLLLGRQRTDARLDGAVRVRAADGDLASALPRPLVRQMRELVRTSFLADDATAGRVVVHVRGAYGSGRRALAHVAADQLDLPVVVADLRRLPDADAFWLVARESFLRPAVLCLEGFDTLLAGDRADDLLRLQEALEAMSQLTFLAGERPWHPRGRWHDTTFVSLHLARPDDAARSKLWQDALIDGPPLDDVGALASVFRFTHGQIRDAVSLAQGLARWRGAEEPDRDDLYAACRAQADADLQKLARKIEPRRGWDDIVLEDDAHAQLWEICHQARYRHVVLGTWGFDRKLSYGKGLAALFSGPPGTGKTLAAEVVAGELGLELYKIDLSQIVSKYIGETEKNLDRIFDAAERANAILFFDEADALFGKRSEVRDSHDRYANVEISYLLQKMEEYEGISILATNLRKHMDDAFLRRLQNIVELPFPDAAQRERIWRVTFPDQTPLAADVDFAVLGQRLRLAGGNIKNIGLLAAFYAAANGGVVRMGHLVAAARREHQKLGRTWNEQAWSDLAAPDVVAATARATITDRTTGGSTPEGAAP